MSSDYTPPEPVDWSRRDFIKGTTTLVSGIPIAGLLTACNSPALQADGSLSRLELDAVGTPVSTLDIELHINGETYPLTVEPRLTLNEAIRERIGLTGTKLSCDRAACGACTVHVNGRAVYSCTLLAVEAAGLPITTIEGLGDGDSLDPIQAAFVEQDAFQCGFCTSGMIMACKALLNQNPSPTENDVRTATAGNLCRCAAYPRIFAATLQAADAMKGG